jgi:Subtilase family/Peptidase inhibitor I9
MQRVLRLLMPVLGVLALAGGAQALGAVPTFHHGLTRGQVTRTARASKRVIVVMKSQQRGRLATTASVRARSATQARQRRPLIRAIKASGGSVRRQFTVLNGFAATVSASEQKRLAASPSVAAVIPDSTITRLQAPETTTTSGTEPPGNPTTPQTGICPSNPAKPLLESEALQTMHVAYDDPTLPQAANLATGNGVKVAFFADGIDINNPDFIRPNGQHVFVDYRDFTGEGPNAPSPSAEAFGDASSVAAQGTVVHDLSRFVNPAHPLPPGCNIRVRGVAPGASLIGMKVFGEGGAFASVIVQGLDWAVTHDHADILSESFGGYAMPDTALDAIKLFNDAAVRSGITVSQGTSDAGATEGMTTPGSDPLVLDAGANTNFRAYAQTASYAFQFSNGSWLNDNISSIGGGGFGQDPVSPDFVAPGEADWAVCTPNPAIYEECTDFKDAPTDLEQFGGVSQSAPLTAGVAALMIEAYRSTHHGHNPSPALVKKILLSTANDLGFPAQEQGAGEVDALKAVRAARSVDGGQRTGHSLLISPSKLTFVEEAGTRADDTFSVTNTGTTTQTVHARARALTQQVSDEKKDVVLPTPAAGPTFIDQFGSPRPFVKTTFTIPSGTDRLIAYDAWSGPNARVGLTLIDPTGAYAAYTRPQGNGNHGQVDVRKPVGGTWTAIVFLRDGTFNGPVHLEFATQRFGAVDSVTPSSRTLRPGETGRFTFQTRLPSNPGDSAHDLVVSDSSGDQTVVPVILRSLVPLGDRGGSFDGTLFGGNGRQFVAQTDTFEFNVPKHRDALRVSLSWPDNAGTEVIGWLIAPDGTLLGSNSSDYVDPNTGAATRTHGLEAFALSPQAGRWRFVATVTTPTGGTVLSTPYHGVIRFHAPIRARGLPDGDKVAAGEPITARIRVRNTGPGTMDVFADPRLAKESETDALAPLFAPPVVKLPGTNVPSFLVPTQVDTVIGAAQADKPIVLEMGYGELGEGDPDLIGVSRGNNAAAAYAGPPEVSNGTWFLAPALRGPFDGPASGEATVGMVAHMKAFDRDADSTTGDWWRVLIDDDAPDYTPLTLGPGESGTITVTFTPQGARGDKVNGILYVDDFSFRTLAGSEHVAFPYSYKIK